MLNYQQIDALFGAPLNTIPKPQTPFKLTTWHVVGGIIVGYVLYKGIKQISKELAEEFNSKIKIEDDSSQ